jgi:hypothetical protein
MTEIEYRGIKRVCESLKVRTRSGTTISWCLDIIADPVSEIQKIKNGPIYKIKDKLNSTELIVGLIYLTSIRNSE